MRHAILIGTLAAAMMGAATQAGAQTSLEGTALVGMGQPTGENDENTDLGPSLAASLGARVTDLFAVHGQLRLAFLNLDSDALDGTHLEIGALPLFHLLPRDARVDVVLGPAIGWYRTEIEGEFLGFDVDATATGFYLGVFAGAFVRVSERLALGGFVSWNRSFPTEVCASAANRTTCDDPDDDNDDTGFITFGLGLLW